MLNSEKASEFTRNSSKDYNFKKFKWKQFEEKFVPLSTFKFAKLCKIQFSIFNCVHSYFIKIFWESIQYCKIWMSFDRKATLIKTNCIHYFLHTLYGNNIPSSSAFIVLKINRLILLVFTLNCLQICTHPDKTENVYEFNL